MFGLMSKVVSLLFEFVSVPCAGYLPALVLVVFDQAKTLKVSRRLLVVPMEWTTGDQGLKPRVLEVVGAILVQEAATVFAPVVEVVAVAGLAVAAVAAVAVAVSVVSAAAKPEEAM